MIKNILFVNDSKKIFNSMNHFLKKKYKLDYASNGKEGLSLFNKNDYDIIITDLEMPIMDGKTMIEKIRKIDGNIPIFMITGKINLELNKDFTTISKPYNSQKIKSSIDNINNIYKQVKRKDSTLNRIIKATEKVFAHKGFAYTTIGDITEEAEVGKGTYYHYFQTKEDVIEYMITNMTTTIVKIINKNIKKVQTISSSSKTKFKIIMEEVCTKIISEFYEYKDIITIIIYSRYALSKKLDEFKKKNLEKIYINMSEFLKIGIKKGYIINTDAEKICYLIFLLIMHYSIDVIFKDKKSKIKSHAQMIHNLVFDGILKR